MSNLQHNKNNVPNGSNSRSNNNGGPGPKGSITCFKCGLTGHKAMHCYQHGPDANNNLPKKAPRNGKQRNGGKGSRAHQSAAALTAQLATLSAQVAGNADAILDMQADAAPDSVVAAPAVGTIASASQPAASPPVPPGGIVPVVNPPPAPVPPPPPVFGSADTDSRAVPVRGFRIYRHFNYAALVLSSGAALFLFLMLRKYIYVIADLCFYMVFVVYSMIPRHLQSLDIEDPAEWASNCSKTVEAMCYFGAWYYFYGKISPHVNFDFIQRSFTVVAFRPAAAVLHAQLDLRADQIAVGKLKHSDPKMREYDMYRIRHHYLGFIATFCREDTPFIGRVLYSVRRYTISEELFSQACIPSAFNPVLKDWEVDSQLHHFITTLHSVNVDRYLSLEGKSVVLDTRIMAYYWFQKCKLRRDNVDFPKAPAL